MPTQNVKRVREKAPPSSPRPDANKLPSIKGAFPSSPTIDTKDPKILTDSMINGFGNQTSKIQKPRTLPPIEKKEKHQGLKRSNSAGAIGMG